MLNFAYDFTTLFICIQQFHFACFCILTMWMIQYVFFYCLLWVFLGGGWYLNITFLEFSQVAALSYNSCCKSAIIWISALNHPTIDVRIMSTFGYWTYCGRDHSCLFLLAYKCKDFSQHTSSPITVECSLLLVQSHEVLLISYIAKDCLYEATYFHTLNIL